MRPATETTILPLFPLPTLLFPGSELPLQIYEPRYLSMVKNCLKTASGFVVALNRDSAEAPSIAFHEVATYGQISDWNTLPNHLLGIRVLGERKVRILDTKIQSDGLLLADVTFLPAETGYTVPASHRTLVLLLKELRKHPLLSALPEEIDYLDAGRVSMLLAASLPFSCAEKQGLLECSDPLQRLDAIKGLIDRF